MSNVAPSIPQSALSEQAACEEALDQMLTEVRRLNELMEQDRAEIERLRAETKRLRTETGALQAETRVVLTSMGAQL